MNNKKVSNHHAIIPTREIAKANLSELPKGAYSILNLIATKLICAVGNPFQYAETVVELKCDTASFTAKGKTILDNGWKEFDRKSDLDKPVKEPQNFQR